MWGYRQLQCGSWNRSQMSYNRKVQTLLILQLWSPNLSRPVRTFEISRIGGGLGSLNVYHIGILSPGPTHNLLLPRPLRLDCIHSGGPASCLIAFMVAWWPRSLLPLYSQTGSSSANPIRTILIPWPLHNTTPPAITTAKKSGTEKWSPACTLDPGATVEGEGTDVWWGASEGGSS